MKFKIIILFFVCIGTLINLSWLGAEEENNTANIVLPEYYPTSFQRKGVIQAIDLRRGYIQIRSGYYWLKNNVSVHSLETEFSSLQQLRVGDVIGIHQSERDNKIYIHEIWVLPEEMAPPPN